MDILTWIDRLNDRRRRERYAMMYDQELVDAMSDYLLAKSEQTAAERDMFAVLDRLELDAMQREMNSRKAILRQTTTEGGLTSDILAQIKERLDAVALVEETTGPMRKSGRSYVARCPFHDDRSPSFSFWPDNNRWKCFGCQKHGDVFDFVQAVRGITFIEAARYLAGRAGVTIPPRTVTRVRPHGL